MLKGLVTVARADVGHVLTCSSVNRVKCMVVKVVIKSSGNKCTDVVACVLFCVSVGLKAFTYVMSFNLHAKASGVQSCTKLCAGSPFLTLSLTLYLLSLKNLPPLTNFFKGLGLF